MTVKQGEDINKQFTSLNDSLASVNSKLLELRREINTLGVRNMQLLKSLSKSEDKLVVAKKDIDLYKSKYRRAEDDLLKYQREQKGVVTGLLVIIGACVIYGTVVF